MIQVENIELKLFGEVTLKYDNEYKELIHKVIRCLLLLDIGYDRFSNKQREVFSTVEEITVQKLSLEKKFQACALTGLTKTIEFNPHAIQKNKIGGVIWLISHESYHLWDPNLHDKKHKEGNANLFANRIKTAIENEPAVHKWED